MSRVSDKPYSVYVLWSCTGRKFYIGIRDNPFHRLEQHNQGISRWTARHRPWEIVWSESHSNYRSARKREYQLKAQKSGQGFFALTGLDPARFSRQAAALGS